MGSGTLAALLALGVVLAVAGLIVRRIRRLRREAARRAHPKVARRSSVRRAMQGTYQFERFMRNAIRRPVGDRHAPLQRATKRIRMLAGYNASVFNAEGFPRPDPDRERVHLYSEAMHGLVTAAAEGKVAPAALEARLDALIGTLCADLTIPRRWPPGGAPPP